jgi:hypothetical protein
MGHERAGINHESSRLHNPWETFTRRDENKHRLEDTSRLCSPQTKSQDVIEKCFAFENRRLDEFVPRRTQILRDFLGKLPHGLVPSDLPYGTDIERRSNNDHIVLVDDRQKHPECEKLIRKACSTCRIFSRKLTIPELRDHLVEDVGCPIQYQDIYAALY